ncbi:MAG: hypothetical protein H7222_17025 [Methylotenera sp.]|nr:hypothetical protein [Oligoflexia bacterium]
MISLSFKSSAAGFLSMAVAGIVLSLAQIPAASAHENLRYHWNVGLSGASLNAQSEKEVQLIRVNSDAVEGDLDLKLILDEDSNGIALLFLSQAKPQRFEAAQLVDGIVLLKKDSTNVVTIVSKNYEPAQGGDIEVVYLRNGISGNYGRFPAQVIRTGDQWAVYTNGPEGRKPFTRMFMKAKRALGQIVGIDSITVQ